jgi:hypothetical protein
MKTVIYFEAPHKWGTWPHQLTFNVSGDILPLAAGYVACFTIIFVSVTVFSTSCNKDVNDVLESEMMDVNPSFP